MKRICFLTLLVTAAVVGCKKSSDSDLRVIQDSGTGESTETLDATELILWSPTPRIRQNSQAQDVGFTLILSVVIQLIRNGSTTSCGHCGGADLPAPPPAPPGVLAECADFGLLRAVQGNEDGVYGLAFQHAPQAH